MGPRSALSIAAAGLLALGLGSGPAAGQAALGPEEEAALAVVQALFDGMRARDADAMAQLFADEARLVTAGQAQDGSPRIAAQEISGWLDAVRGSEAYLDERIWDAESAEGWRVIQVVDTRRREDCGFPSS